MAALLLAFGEGPAGPLGGAAMTESGRKRGSRRDKPGLEGEKASPPAEKPLPMGLCRICRLAKRCPQARTGQQIWHCARFC